MEGVNNIRRTPRKRELASSDDVNTAGKTTRIICITDSPKSSPKKVLDSGYHANYDRRLSPRKVVLSSKLKTQDITDILNSDSESDVDLFPAKKRQVTSTKRKIFTNSPAKSRNCNPTTNESYILEEPNNSLLNSSVKNLLKQVKDVTVVLNSKTETFEKTLGSVKKSNGQIDIVSPIKMKNLFNKFSSSPKFVHDVDENGKNVYRPRSQRSARKLELNEEGCEQYQNKKSVSKRNSVMHESALNETPKKVLTPSAPRSTKTRRKIDLSVVESISPAVALRQQDEDDYNSTPKKRGRKSVVNKIVDDEERQYKVEYNSTLKKTGRRGKVNQIVDDEEQRHKAAKKTGRKNKENNINNYEDINEIEQPEETLENVSSPLKLAMSRLHVSSIPHRLPCREAEFNNVYCFVKGKLIDDIGGCMYISGVPGTGKTATVRSVIKELKSEIPNMNVPKFQFIEINGLQLSEPRQAYVQILKHMNGRKATAEQAQQLLEDMFTKSRTKTPPTIILVDELDMLCTRRQDVIYNMLDWPSKAKTCLIVITIANTMDLPERLLMGRVTSRLGLTRLTFQPYTFKQLEEIVKARLSGIQAFDADAIQFVARKVAAVSGDARRALNICRRATEIAEYSTNNSETVLMKHVDQALLEMFTSPVVQIIKNLSKSEQLLLCAVAAIVQRTGMEKCSFRRVYEYFRTLSTFDGVTVPSSTRTLSIVAKLGNYRLLLTEHSQLDINQHVMLNINSDDLHFALQSSNDNNTI